MQKAGACSVDKSKATRCWGTGTKLSLQMKHKKIAHGGFMIKTSPFIWEMHPWQLLPHYSLAVSQLKQGLWTPGETFWALTIITIQIFPYLHPVQVAIICTVWTEATAQKVLLMQMWRWRDLIKGLIFSLFFLGQLNSTYPTSSPSKALRTDDSQFPEGGKLSEMVPQSARDPPNSSSLVMPSWETDFHTLQIFLCITNISLVLTRFPHLIKNKVHCYQNREPLIQTKSA